MVSTVGFMEENLTVFFLIFFVGVSISLFQPHIHSLIIRNILYMSDSVSSKVEDRVSLFSLFYFFFHEKRSTRDLDDSTLLTLRNES